MIDTPIISARSFFPRSAKQVCEDVDAEIRHHLELKQNGLVGAGLSIDEAQRLASDEFGDVDQIRAEMISIGLAPWRRLAIGLSAMMILIIVLILSFAWMLRLEATSLANEIQALESRISGQQSAIEAMRLSDRLRPAQTIRTIQVHGAIRDPRLWTFDRDTEVTLSQLIQKSGGLLDDATGRVILIDQHSDAASEPRIYALGDLLRGAAPDPLLARSCTLVVEARAD